MLLRGSADETLTQGPGLPLHVTGEAESLVGTTLTHRWALGSLRV